MWKMPVMLEERARKKLAEFLQNVDNNDFVWLDEIAEEAKKMFTSDSDYEPELMPKTPPQKSRRKKPVSSVKNDHFATKRLSRRASTRLLSKRITRSRKKLEINVENASPCLRVTRSRAASSARVSDAPLNLAEDQLPLVVISANERRSAELQAKQVPWASESEAAQNLNLRSSQIRTTSQANRCSVRTSMHSRASLAERYSLGAKRKRMMQKSIRKSLSRQKTSQKSLSASCHVAVAEEITESGLMIEPTSQEVDVNPPMTLRSHKARVQADDQGGNSEKSDEVQKQPQNAKLSRRASTRLLSKRITRSRKKLEINVENASPCLRVTRSRAASSARVSDAPLNLAEDQLPLVVISANERRSAELQAKQVPWASESEAAQNLNLRSSQIRTTSQANRCSVRTSMHSRASLAERYSLGAKRKRMMQKSIRKSLSRQKTSQKSLSASCHVAVAEEITESGLMIEPTSQEVDVNPPMTLRSHKARVQADDQGGNSEKSDEVQKQPQNAKLSRRASTRLLSKRITRSRKKLEINVENASPCLRVTRSRAASSARVSDAPLNLAEDQLPLVVISASKEEERRHKEQMQKKREEEEQEKARKIAEQHQLELEREKKLSAERELEKRKEQERLKAQQEHEQKEKEKAVRLHKELLAAAKEKERLIKELEEKEKKLQEQRQQEEKREKAASEAEAKASSKQLNTTVVIENSTSCNSYPMTPQGPKHPKIDVNNYGMDLNSDDSTDDESQPRKPIPAWATGNLLRQATIHQHYQPVDTTALFGVVKSPKLEEIFKKSKPRYFKRNSSAVWNSPPSPGGRNVPYALKM